MHFDHTVHQVLSNPTDDYWLFTKELGQSLSLEQTWLQDQACGQKSMNFCLVTIFFQNIYHQSLRKSEHILLGMQALISGTFQRFPTLSKSRMKPSRGPRPHPPLPWGYPFSRPNPYPNLKLNLGECRYMTRNWPRSPAGSRTKHSENIDKIAWL